jgi:transaldolase
MRKINNLKIKIFADGADVKDIFKLNKIRYISGFTTNPSLMSQSNIDNYKYFAKTILSKVTKKSVSFEVISDSLKEMEKQAMEIASWSNNVFVKIPFTNSKGLKTLALIKKLSLLGVKLNVTALFTFEQVQQVVRMLSKNSENYLSIFSGRIADTGVDPALIVTKSIKEVKNLKNTKILWASCREIFNIFEANRMGCHIITVPNAILKKFYIIGKDLNSYSVETCKDFYLDSKKIIF